MEVGDLVRLVGDHRMEHYAGIIIEVNGVSFLTVRVLWYRGFSGAEWISVKTMQPYALEVISESR